MLMFRFHLYKENKDTQEALGIIGKMLGIQVCCLFFALCLCHVKAVYIVIITVLITPYKKQKRKKDSSVWLRKFIIELMVIYMLSAFHFLHLDFC